MSMRFISPNNNRFDDDDFYIYAPFPNNTRRPQRTPHPMDASFDRMNGQSNVQEHEHSVGAELPHERNIHDDIEEQETIVTDDTMTDHDAVEDDVEVSAQIDDVDNVDDIDDEYDEDENEENEEEIVSKEDYDALMDRYQRLISDWDNYRRRSAEDIAQAKTNANRNLVEALIPTFDHFGFALAHSKQMSDNPAAQEVAKGFEAIYRAMVDSLGREGLVIIDPTPGSPFDMNENQAVEQVADTGQEPESIVRVVQVGYKFNDYVIRPAMVAVAS